LEITICTHIDTSGIKFNEIKLHGTAYNYESGKIENGEPCTIVLDVKLENVLKGKDAETIKED